MTDWRHGGVEYPLSASTTHPLLDDLDPSLAAIIDFLVWSIERALGERFVNQAKLEGLVKLKTVARVVSVELTPTIVADKMAFPIFAVWRRATEYEQHTLSYWKTLSELGWQYVLPALSPRHTVQLDAMLRGVDHVVSNAVRMGYHPDYKGGAHIWAELGIIHASTGRSEYGPFELQESGSNAVYRRVQGRISIVERDMPLAVAPDQNAPFAAVSLFERASDQTEFGVVDFHVFRAPKLTSVTPNSGSEDGGTEIMIAGSGFRPGTRTTVDIGGAAATDVVVLSETAVRCTTPVHRPGMVDVTVTNIDGQAHTLAAGFTFIAP